MKFLTAAPDETVGEEVDRNQELYYMVQASVQESHALNLLEKSEEANGPSGHHVWQELAKWYMDPSRKDTIVAHWESLLNALKLDTDTPATEFINCFKLYVRNIEKHEGPWPDYKKVREFKKRVVDEDYETEIRTCRVSFADFIDIVRLREQDLVKDHISGQGKKNRRYKAEGSVLNQGGGETPVTCCRGRSRFFRLA